MVFESIPGCILQVLTVLRLLVAGQQPTTAAMISILISAFTTGFTSAIFTFDFDVDPVRRTVTPDFYGMIPDEALSRTIVFVCLLLQWLYRFARNDAWFFINITGPGGVIATFISRTAFKVIVDFTGLMQFRGPGVMGGIYWAINMVIAFLASFVSIYLYFERFEEKGSGLKKEAVYQIAVGISGAWMAASGVFLSVIKKKYIGTFFSTQTGNEWVQSLFLEGATDQVKAEILGCNPHCWKSIRPQVGAWLLENWDKWEDEKPEWFSDIFMSWVDDDIMPPDALRRLKLKGGGARRRSSLGERLGGSIRQRRPSSATIVPIGKNVQESG